MEQNSFGGGADGIYLYNRHEGTIIRNNTVSTESTGIVAIAGTHGIFLPIVPNEGCVIEHNTINGGADAGIAVWSGSGWVIRHNTISNAFRGIWTEWGPFNFTPLGIIQPTVAENNVVANNHLRSNVVGVFIGARGRNNTYQGNSFKNNAFADYFLNGPEDLGIITMGPASGNTIIGATLKNGRVVDVSGCYPGVGGCPQIDEDGDGFTSEDPVDNQNNDNDFLFGLSLIDEDLAETPNYITGMQAIYGPVTPPWASASDTDGDGLKDSLERKLEATGFRVDSDNPDTDGDGMSDADEYMSGTLESRGRF